MGSVATHSGYLSSLYGHRVIPSGLTAIYDIGIKDTQYLSTSEAPENDDIDEMTGQHFGCTRGLDDVIRIINGVGRSCVEHTAYNLYLNLIHVTLGIFDRICARLVIS